MKNFLEKIEGGEKRLIPAPEVGRGLTAGMAGFISLKEDDPKIIRPQKMGG